MKIEGTELVQAFDSNTEVLVYVYKWLLKEPVKDQYIEHPRSFFLLWNYYRRIGFLKVVRKLKSRFYERDRNHKVAGVFVGRVLEGQYGDALSDSSERALVLCYTNHSASSNIHVIDKRCIVTLAAGTDVGHRDAVSFPNELREFIAWVSFQAEIWTVWR